MTKRMQHPYYLIIGKILRPHGVKGELRVKVMSDYPERVRELETVFVGDDPQRPEAVAYSVQAARLHQDYLLLKLKEIPDRNQAEPLRGQYVMIDLENAIPLDDDEFYLYEVIGLDVQTTGGAALGTVQDVIETGANDVYIVNSRRYGRLLLPIHGETLIHIDFEQGIITVQLPDGLLPDDPTP